MAPQRHSLGSRDSCLVVSYHYVRDASRTAFPHLRALHPVAKGGNQNRHRLDQVRRDPEQCGPLTRGFPDPGDVQVLEIANSSMHHFERIGGCGPSKVVTFDQGDREPPLRRIPGCRRSADSAADHRNVEVAGGES